MTEAAHEESAFKRKLAERRRAQARAELEKQKAEFKASFSDDLIPDEDSGYKRTAQDEELDQVIDHLGVIAAYNTWCKKMVPDVRPGQTEGIKISCPIPGHRDSNPSAWISTEKETWFCGTCQIGGDAHDIAAYGLGYPVPGYKEGSNFSALRKDMARDLGYLFVDLPGGAVEVIEPEVEKESIGTVATPEPTDDPSTEDTEAQIIELYDDGDEEDTDFLPLDWEAITPPGTYLHAYMTQVRVDDVPEEYHFWNALLGLGFTLGRDVALEDFHPVYSNLFICTIGPSGSGKSKARSYLDKLMSEALPHDWADPNSKGVRKISAPGSAEVLIHNFQKPVADPVDPKRIAYYAPVRGLIDYNELSSLIGRAGRMGNVVMPTLMQFYDMETIVSTSSMSTGSKEAHEPFASALTTTQPKALRNLITKADDASGFLNRWVFVPGQTKKRYAIGGIRVDMTPVIPYMKSISGWAGSFRGSPMTWSDEAAALFTDFFHRQIEPDKKKSDNELFVRIDLLLKKLILLFTANRKLKIVPIESVQDAISCYAYLIAAYGIPAAQIGNTLGNEINEAILYQAKKQFELDGRGVTLSQVARTLKRRKYPHEMLLKACDSLVKLGFLKLESTRPGSVGKPTMRYRYVE